MVPIAQLTMIRNRDRSTRKQFPVIKALGEEVAFNFVFEGSPKIIAEGYPRYSLKIY